MLPSPTETISEWKTRQYVVVKGDREYFESNDESNEFSISTKAKTTFTTKLKDAYLTFGST